MVPNGQLNGPGHPGCFTLVRIHPHTFAHIHSSATMPCCLWSVPSCTDPGACAYKLTCFFQIKTALVFAHVADCLDTFSSFSFPLLSLTVTNKNWACIFYSWFTFPPSWHQAERFLLEQLMFLFRYFFLAIFKCQHFVLQFPNRCYKASSSFSSHYSLGHGEFSAGHFDNSNAKAPKKGKINSKPTVNSGCDMPLKAHRVVWGVSVDSCQVSLEMFIKVQLWALARPLCYLGLCLGLLSCWKINLHPRLGSSGAGYQQVCQYITAFNFPSTLTSIPVPAADKNSQYDAATIMLHCRDGVHSFQWCEDLLPWRAKHYSMLTANR